MSTKGKRFMLTVPDDVEADAAEVKRELFCDKPYSEMYRQLIRMGLASLKDEQEKKEKAVRRGAVKHPIHHNNPQYIKKRSRHFFGYGFVSSVRPSK